MGLLSGGSSQGRGYRALPVLSALAQCGASSPAGHGGSEACGEPGTRRPRCRLAPRARAGLYIIYYEIYGLCTPAWLLGFSGVGGAQIHVSPSPKLPPRHTLPCAVAPSRQLLFALGPAQPVGSGVGGPAPAPCGRGTWQPQERGAGCSIQPCSPPPGTEMQPAQGLGTPWVTPARAKGNGSVRPSVCPSIPAGSRYRLGFTGVFPLPRAPLPATAPGGCCNGTDGVYRANPPPPAPGTTFPFYNTVWLRRGIFSPSCWLRPLARSKGTRGTRRGRGRLPNPSPDSHPACWEHTAAGRRHVGRAMARGHAG